MGEVPVRKIPEGVRTLPVASPKPADSKINAEHCGRGEKSPRRQHLDELDGDD